MKTRPRQFEFLLAALLFAGAAAVDWALGHYRNVFIAPAIAMVVRWAAVLSFCGYAWLRRSLTPWIFAGMLAGGLIGHDWPQAAVNLQVLSAIFLKLIKTIVAPLVFSTLVVGIFSRAVATGNTYPPEMPRRARALSSALNIALKLGSPETPVAM